MKNLFTFIVALFMATSVYAQGTYAVANGETFTPGYKISKVPNITAYYMANDGNVFNAGKKTANWADSDFENYVSITKTGAPAQFDGKMNLQVLILSLSQLMMELLLLVSK